MSDPIQGQKVKHKWKSGRATAILEPFLFMGNFFSAIKEPSNRDPKEGLRANLVMTPPAFLQQQSQFFSRAMVTGFCR